MGKNSKRGSTRINIWTLLFNVFINDIFYFIKFQAIAVGKKTFDKKPVFNIGEANISCDDVVKLLGVDIDFRLNFDYHIANICKKTVPQLNILKRIVKNLSKLNRLTIFLHIYLVEFQFMSYVMAFLF